MYLSILLSLKFYHSQFGNSFTPEMKVMIEEIGYCCGSWNNTLLNHNGNAEIFTNIR
jgi:hypothetical protein